MSRKWQSLDTGIAATPAASSSVSLSAVPNDPNLVRRANCLVGWFEDDVFVLENYLNGRQTVLDPRLMPALSGLAGSLTRQKVLQRLGGDLNGSVLDTLLKQGVLLRCGSEPELRDAAVDLHWAWGREARYFHYSTSRTAFTFDAEHERRHLEDVAKHVPQPPAFKDYGYEGIALDDAVLAPNDIWDTLGRRRTGRAFTNRPIGFAELSAILKYTWGISDLRPDPGVGVVALKTSPSGGARHPVEVYPIVLSAEDVPPGIYHYCAGRHCLEPLQNGDFAQDAVAVCTNQPWVADTAVVFLMTGVLQRSSWKYPQSHAYRVLLLDAGHLGQTFHLVCTALGLSPWTSAALDESKGVDVLAVDGSAEVLLYASACGYAAGR